MKQPLEVIGYRQELWHWISLMISRFLLKIPSTGNARTPPHLHFGIYSNEPIDPFHFITETDTVPENILGDTLLLGEIRE
ncbi:MAG: hypothetical protein U9R49_07430 [Bacteroidota bacterium]|nr:hypothetical protein [Bacteroidota bacterium]